MRIEDLENDLRIVGEVHTEKEFAFLGEADKYKQDSLDRNLEIERIAKELLIQESLMKDKLAEWDFQSAENVKKILDLELQNETN